MGLTIEHECDSRPALSAASVGSVVAFPQPGITGRRRASRGATLRRGAASSLRLMLVPFGRHAARFHRGLQTEQRLRQGLVILLPGIDGCTTVCDNVARGLHIAGCDMAVEIHDWRSFRGWNPLHLATYRRNREQANQIAERIRNYQAEYPGRPVHLIGHSAGAGVALFVLQQLPLGVQIHSAILLAAAVSRRFDVDSLLDATTNGIWNFSSRGDLPTVGLGTLIFGTVDRRHSVSAGALGFSTLSARAATGSSGNRQLHEVSYQYEMAASWNFGGHFGCTNSAFDANYIAPILR